MSREPPPPHRTVIEAALHDSWLTADPAEPTSPAAAAEQVEMYLNSSGYRITPDTRPRAPMTPRLAYTLSVTALALGATLASATHWLTFIPFALTAAFYADLGHRRRPKTQQSTHTCQASTRPSKMIRFSEPLSEAEYEAFRTKWLETYGSGKAHLVELLDEDDAPTCTCAYGQRCPHCPDYTPTPKD